MHCTGGFLWGDEMNLENEAGKLAVRIQWPVLGLFIACVISACAVIGGLVGFVGMFTK
jgi:hypothetical protein